MIAIKLNNEHIASFVQDKKEYLISYKTSDIKKSIALSLPNIKKFYTYNHRFPPYFEMFLPEGYLYEIFKQMLTKEYGYIDDYLVFSLLCSNIEARISFHSEFDMLDFHAVDIDDILQNDSEDTFNKLLHTFLDKNAISGVQPKTVALVKDKETLHIKEYIIKTWGAEYPYLAENEYFCLEAMKKAGLITAKTQLSKNKKFLLIENFIFQNEEVFGFEEVLSLMDKNRDNKYQGSYEQIAKIIMRFCSNKTEALKSYYKTVIMNFLLKNGDAHLKNFGLLFTKDFSKVSCAPVYDVVTTTAYIFKDRPALTLDGKKIWHSKQTLVIFGQKSCLLTKQEASSFYEECKGVLKESILSLEQYIKDNPHFHTIGSRMLDSWKDSLDTKAKKELSDAIVRDWN